MSDPTDAILGGDPGLLEALDAYAADAEGLPTRPELVRRIVRDWLITNGYYQADPLDALEDDTEQMTE